MRTERRDKPKAPQQICVTSLKRISANTLQTGVCATRPPRDRARTSARDGETGLSFQPLTKNGTSALHLPSKLSRRPDCVDHDANCRARRAQMYTTLSSSTVQADQALAPSRTEEASAFSHAKTPRANAGSSQILRTRQLCEPARLCGRTRGST